MRLCLFLILFLNPSHSINLVFVHIGNELPSYIYRSIYQARLFNPDINFYLILNKRAHDRAQKHLLNLFKVSVFFIEKLSISKDHQYFIQNKKSKYKLWIDSSERIFYIGSLAKRLNLSDVFHIENDVLVYFDFRENINIFRKYQNIAAVFDSDNRGILSIIYFKNHESVNILSRAISIKSKTKNNDMQVIAFLKSSEGSSSVDNLPIVPISYLETNPLFSKKGESAINPFMYVNNFNSFNSIFDAAALGQYLGGINSDPTPGFINETAFFDPSKFEYVWEIDAHQRNIPYIKFNDEKIRINNLHIHSKDLDRFLSKPFIGLQ